MMDVRNEPMDQNQPRKNNMKTTVMIPSIRAVPSKSSADRSWVAIEVTTVI